MGTYFLKIPRNIRSFEVSSGGFSVAAWALFALESEEDEAAVEAGEASKEPDDAEAILIQKWLVKRNKLCRFAKMGCLRCSYREMMVEPRNVSSLA